MKFKSTHFAAHPVRRYQVIRGMTKKTLMAKNAVKTLPRAITTKRNIEKGIVPRRYGILRSRP